MIDKKNKFFLKKAYYILKINVSLHVE